MPPNHAAVMIDDSIQVINGRVLPVILLPDAEFAEVQVPEIKQKSNIMMSIKKDKRFNMRLDALSLEASST